MIWGGGSFSSSKSGKPCQGLDRETSEADRCDVAYEEHPICMSGVSGCFFFDVENRCSRCDFLWIPESHDEILRIMYGKLVSYIDHDGNIEACF